MKVLDILTPQTRKRRGVDPTTCQRLYTPEELAFMLAMEKAMKETNTRFPTCRDVLKWANAAGWRLVK